MKTLEERIQRIEDRQTCEELMYRYHEYLDNGYDADGVASLFVEDGLWSITGAGATVRGVDAIKQHVRNLDRNISWGQHNILAPNITVAEDGLSATGTFCLIGTFTMNDNRGEDAYIMVGSYKNKFVKAGGEWKFQELTGHVAQTAPWDLGWVKAGMTKEEW